MADTPRSEKDAKRRSPACSDRSDDLRREPYIGIGHCKLHSRFQPKCKDRVGSRGIDGSHERIVDIGAQRILPDIRIDPATLLVSQLPHCCSKFLGSLGGHDIDKANMV